MAAWPGVVKGLLSWVQRALWAEWVLTRYFTFHLHFPLCISFTFSFLCSLSRLYFLKFCILIFFSSSSASAMPSGKAFRVRLSSNMCDPYPPYWMRYLCNWERSSPQVKDYRRHVFTLSAADECSKARCTHPFLSHRNSFLLQSIAWV